MVDPVTGPMRANPHQAARRWRFLAWVGAAATALFFSTAALSDQVRDPMRPPALGPLQQWSALQSEPSGPQLQAIRFSAGDRSATIDGRGVKVGDRVGNARVVQITKEAVVLDDGGVRRTLKLFPDIDKRIISPMPHPKH